MSNGRTSQFAISVSFLSLGIITYATPADAVVTEPDGTLVPQPLTEDITPGVVQCCDVAADGSNISLEALFAYRGEQIHWQNDAATEPSYFSPLCGFKGTMILRGGGCKIDFGWYNVDLNNPLPPPDTEIFPLVSRAEIEAMFLSGAYGTPNADMAFHPHVGETEIQGQLIDNLRSDARYRGGLIALATLGNDSRIPITCSQTHYSEARLNQPSIYGGPWIMAVVWKSTLTPNAFYIGFEDLPTDPDNFAKLTPDGYYNDGDFNDFVYFVEGVTCEGGGLPCLTTAEGACGYGLTECLPNGDVVCVEQLQPSEEVCDNIDNNCDGLVDNDAVCPPGEVCDQGVCKPNCSGGEFPCPSPFVCDGTTGLCMDPACVEMTCEPGQVCIGGQCIGGCSNVVCPWGQVCQLGRCVDPCKNRTCPANMVCEGGICVESCHCRMCGPGLVCDYVTGKCEPPGCETDPNTGARMSCGPNEVCLVGDGGPVCVNKCTNVICPGGAACDETTGECGVPLEPPAPVDYELEMLPNSQLLRTYPDTDAGPGRREIVEPREDGSCCNVIREVGPEEDPWALAGTGGPQDPADNTADGLEGGKSGCNCRAVGGKSRAFAAAGLVLLALGLGRLRRKMRRRAARS